MLDTIIKIGAVIACAGILLPLVGVLITVNNTICFLTVLLFLLGLTIIATCFFITLFKM